MNCSYKKTIFLWYSYIILVYILITLGASMNYMKNKISHFYKEETFPNFDPD